MTVPLTIWWHWADGCGVHWDNHFNIGHYEGKEWKGRVNHHYPSARGNLSGELNEFAFWTDISMMERIAYTPHMQKFR